MSRPDWDDYLIGIAKAVSARASCPRATCGVVIATPDHHILTTGYNGAPSGQPDCLEKGCLMVNGYCLRSIHAEQNAIASAAKQGISLNGSECWTWFEIHNDETQKLYMYKASSMALVDLPCQPCRNVIMASGIVKVWWINSKEKSLYSI